jgi:hypothetical protein
MYFIKDINELKKKRKTLPQNKIWTFECLKMDMIVKGPYHS